MADLQTQLAQWYEKLQALPSDVHLLCPRLNDDDNENYQDLHDPGSEIDAEERRKRIKDGEERLVITYWNSLVLGFDRRDAGQWADDLENRLNACLQNCADCVLNWHMQRKKLMHQFAE